MGKQELASVIRNKTRMKPKNWRTVRKKRGKSTDSNGRRYVRKDGTEISVNEFCIIPTVLLHLCGTEIAYRGKVRRNGGQNSIAPV